MSCSWDGMISSSVQILNSDVVTDYTYENSEQLMDSISKYKTYGMDSWS
jgi:hypothetical protein